MGRPRIEREIADFAPGDVVAYRDQPTLLIVAARLPGVDDVETRTFTGWITTRVVISEAKLEGSFFAARGRMSGRVNWFPNFLLLDVTVENRRGLRRLLWVPDPWSLRLAGPEHQLAENHRRVVQRRAERLEAAYSTLIQQEVNFTRHQSKAAGYAEHPMFDEVEQETEA